MANSSMDSIAGRSITVPYIRTSLGRADLKNIGLLLVGLLCVLLFVPPTRSFPIVDDWAYTRASESLLTFDYHQQVGQALAFSSSLVGALFMAIFGTSFTVLTISTLALSVACLLAIYTLFRELRIGPCYALLGTALVMFNPVYLFLSYSFMTDVPFLAFLMLGALCYLRGVRPQGSKSDDIWLAMGSIAVAFSYLTRQFGILLSVAVLVYLWWSGRLSLRSAVAVIAIPILSAAGFTLWENSQHTPGVSEYASIILGGALRDPLRYILGRAGDVGMVDRIIKTSGRHFVR